MESLFNILADNVGNGVFSAILLGLLSTMYMFKKDIPVWINRLFNLKNKLTTKSLEHHDLFSTCIRVENEIKIKKFYTHGEYDITKSKMCKDFTKYKIEVCSKGFKDILNEDIEGMNPDAFKQYIIALQTEMHSTYIDKIKADWANRGISNDDIDYVIDLFETFRYDVIQGFENRINSIFSSTTYHNNTRRLLAIFEMWAFGIDILPRDMETTFETLNGRFKSINY